MHATVIPAAALSDEQTALWRRLQRDDHDCDSPFFCPEFTRAAAAVRDDVYVGLLYRSDRLAGFFPFQRKAWTAEPPGAGFSEFHGVIAERGWEWRAADLLSACGLMTWRFDHLPARQAAAVGGTTIIGESPCMDLSRGFEAYRQERRQSGSEAMQQVDRKARKLAREVAPPRFVLDTDSEEAFQCLLRWKSAQHKRTGVPDVFQHAWVVDFLRQVRDTRGGDFRGLMSGLYAGERLIAVHLGVRTGHVAHVWYPAYDVAYSRYSPGMTLFAELARALAEDGVRRIDFGPGPQRYKQSLKNDQRWVARGAVDRYAPARLARSCWTQARAWVRDRVVAAHHLPS